MGEAGISPAPQFRVGLAVRMADGVVFIGLPGVGLLGGKTGFAAVVCPLAPTRGPAKAEGLQQGADRFGRFVRERNPDPAANPFGIQFVPAAEVHHFQHIRSL